MSWTRRMGLELLALIIACAVWLPAVHLLFLPADDELTTDAVSGRAAALAKRQLTLWEGDAGARGEAQERMRVTNPEWDFMGRTFVGLSLANMALRQPAEDRRYLAALDRILADTLRLERERGHLHFLLGYARAGRWVVQPPRSLFVDGEIALMLAARCLVEDRPDYHEPLRERVEAMIARMRRSPRTLSGESYPDECWTFCNAAALASIRLADRVLGLDHGAFLREWVANARRVLVHPATGLLASKYTLAGQLQDGPEGSSIWMAIHCLWIVDEPFARDQYRRARRELGQTLLGFGYAREWPPSWVGPTDVDSGPIIPYLNASAGSSGLALLGAGTAGDREFLGALLASLDLAAFPIQDEAGGLRYAAGNQVGDAVLLYSQVQGPLWARARQGGTR